MPVRGDGGISPSDPSQGSQHVNDNACAFRFVPPWRKIGTIEPAHQSNTMCCSRSPHYKTTIDCFTKGLLSPDLSVSNLVAKSILVASLF